MIGGVLQAMLKFRVECGRSRFYVAHLSVLCSPSAHPPVILMLVATRQVRLSNFAGYNVARHGGAYHRYEGKAAGC
jgi:hypothetical protein